MKFLKTKMLVIPLAIVEMVFASNAFADPGRTKPYVSCTQDQVKYGRRSVELQRIVEADQADRPNNQMRPGAAFRDRQRRKRIGEIFGEGCFKEPADYAAAALVFQHGDHPDHFFQVFLWSKRGVELGDAAQKQMMGLGLDRYLVNIGHKQLFASQASKQTQDPCWCLDPVEISFPDEMRTECTKRTLAKALEWVNSMNAGTSCPPAVQCDKALKPSPKGTVPGFW